MWSAGYSFPGCIPENDPVTFDTWQEASEYLRDVLNTWADQEDCENDDDVPTETFMRAINSVRDLESGDYENEPWSSHHQISGYVFWIERL